MLNLKPSKPFKDVCWRRKILSNGVLNKAKITTNKFQQNVYCWLTSATFLKLRMILIFHEVRKPHNDGKIMLQLLKCVHIATIRVYIL